MKSRILKHLLTIFLISIFTTSCEDFVEVDAPNNRLIQEQVFSSEETAISAMQGIYNELFVAAFSNGYTSSITLLSGLSSDNIQNITSGNVNRMEFEQNEITPDNQNNLEIWASAYNTIYNTNSFLQGLSGSENISSELKTQLEGEALFVRAFTYFYLVNLYGNVPLILTTDYKENQLASRTPTVEVYDQIIADLLRAEEVLNSEYRDGERTNINQYTADALLARVYLFVEDWEMAENYSSQVIGSTSTYELLEDPNEVFLANSREAIWQISPLGDGQIVTNTKDGNLFIIDPIFSFFAIARLPMDLLNSFEENDKRLINWISYNEGRDAFFPFKYKIRNTNEVPPKEYSMVLRLAEQYLVRAEARVHQGNLQGGIEDINVIRKRAGLELLDQTDPEINEENLLDEILKEKRKELFAEWGHRWLDLKRTGRAEAVLGSNNPLWENTDVLYPIPEAERMRNPNLSQNPGY
ncbi:RagB/SusD family nutrient uptake outer membrane protein [Zunongwangia sp. H14]|uniref:RagB/SusD family nutrient uptake outer membrane protein n=1 Tax=Zunongwangia sp. H14 TaxID=3240792 RepID=UPI003567EFB9